LAHQARYQQLTPFERQWHALCINGF